MNATRHASVLGLGFGDCGKGLFIDALASRWHAHTVVRFNGGAQAGHNVIAEQRHHTFSQFGAATFVPGVRTLLLHPMIVHPTALLVEAQVLAGSGVKDALSRLQIDGRCRLTTPFHQAAGRLRELIRGSAAHGTCGVGVGETVRHSLEHPAQVISYGDMLPTSGRRAAEQLDRLQNIRTTLLGELEAQTGPEHAGEMQVLRDEHLASRWLSAARLLARQCPPASDEEIHAQLTRPGTVLYEGAQGVLLDEWRGFHPHTTWSSIRTTSLEQALARYGMQPEIEHYGVLRSYLTRHGPGPLPTEDRSLDSYLPEPHNAAHGWQGRFRRGHPDAVLLRYALESVGDLTGLLVSHLDAFSRGVSLRWCEAYQIGSRVEHRLPCPAEPDLAMQEQITSQLLRAVPLYESRPIQNAGAFLDHLATLTDLPVTLTSHGPTAHDLR